MSDKENFARNTATEINVTKNQPSYHTPQQNQFQNSMQPKSVESDADSRESVKPEQVKRSFFGRLQQINIFGSRNKNDNTIKNIDDNNSTQDEYKNNNNEDIDNNVQSEREHLPHGRYLPPHAQSLYKAHTQSIPPTQTNQSQISSNKDDSDPLRQIASQISKLGNSVNKEANKNNGQITNNANRSYDSRYKKSAQDYRYNNTTTNKIGEYYSDTRNNINNSPESLFDDDLPETEEFAAFRRLISDGVSAEDEEQRRLASILGEPQEDSQTEQQIELPIDNGNVPSYPAQTNRVSRYPNNRNYGNNIANNTKPNNTRTGNTNPTNNADKRWTPAVNNQTHKPNTVVRGKRGSRFVANGQKVGDDNNLDNTNRPDVPQNSDQQHPYQSRQSAVNAGQFWQTNVNNNSTIPQTGRNTAPPQTTNSHPARNDQNWRGRKLPDNRNIAETQNDPIGYNNSLYQPNTQSQSRYAADYPSQISNELTTEDADYIDEYNNDEIISDAERLSFTQAHKNIPSWNDAVESIVETNIQRHSRHYQNVKRR
jgi:hypothetical protein